MKAIVEIISADMDYLLGVLCMLYNSDNFQGGEIMTDKFVEGLNLIIHVTDNNYSK